MEVVVKIVGWYYKWIPIYKKIDNIFQKINKV
jgi:hypothetical protein